jgi:hypothetical protein
MQNGWVFFLFFLPFLLATRKYMKCMNCSQLAGRSRLGGRQYYQLEHKQPRATIAWLARAAEK